MMIYWICGRIRINITQNVCFTCVPSRDKSTTLALSFATLCLCYTCPTLLTTSIRQFANNTLHKIIFHNNKQPQLKLYVSQSCTEWMNYKLKTEPRESHLCYKHCKNISSDLERLFCILLKFENINDVMYERICSKIGFNFLRGTFLLKYICIYFTYYCIFSIWNYPYCD